MAFGRHAAVAVSRREGGRRTLSLLKEPRRRAARDPARAS